MKNSIIIMAVTAVLLTACSETHEAVDDIAQQDNRIQVALGVNRMDVSTTRTNALGGDGTKTVTAKSFSGREPTEDNPFYPMVWFSDNETKGIYTLTDDAHRNKVKFTSTTLTYPDNDIFYNTTDKSKKTWCFGLYPTKDNLWGIENTAGWSPAPVGTVLYADISGQEDLMFADQVAGSINDKFTSEIGGANDNRLQFHHLLTWLKIRVNPAEQGAGIAWGKVKLIQVKTKQRVRIDLGTGQIYNKASDEYWVNAFVPDPDDPVNPQQYKDLEPEIPEDPMIASVLVVPDTHYEIRYQTEEMNAPQTIDVPLNMLVEENGELVTKPVTTSDEAKNKVFVISLFFYQREKVEAICTLEPMTDEMDLVYGKQGSPLIVTPDPPMSFTYTGSPRTYGGIIVEDGTTTLTASDYDLYYSNNINAGTGVVTAVGKNTYAGKVGTHAFIIDKDPASGNIAFDSPSLTKTFGDPDFTNEMTPTLTGTNTEPGKPITYTLNYTSSNTDVATVDATTGQVHIKHAHPSEDITITATITDGANHSYASPPTKNYSLRVNRALGELNYATPAVEKVYSTDKFTNPLTFTGDGAPIYTSSDPTVASVDGLGEVTLLKAGTSTIKASVAGGIGIDYRYTPAETSYTLTVNKAQATLSFSESSVNKKIGNPNFTIPLTNTGAVGNVTYSSTDTGVATINVTTGEVTIQGTGITYISATASDTDQYHYDTSTVTYTLTVTN